MDNLHRIREMMQPVTASAWTKSSLSHANGNCVEVADLLDGQVGMRDSKDIGGTVLQFPAEEWRAFLSGIHGGEFDSFAP
jgi:Domain of unknown function (DUF397)